MSLWTLHGPVTCELSGPFHSFNFYRPKFSWQMLSALQTVRSGRIGATSIQRGNLCTKIISAPADICVRCVEKSYHAIRNQRLSRMTWNTHLPKMSWGLGGWQGSPKSRNACLRDSAAQSLQGGQFDSPKALVKFVAKRQALPRCRVDLCNTLKWTTRARRKQRLYFVYLYRHMCIIIMYANII